MVICFILGQCQWQYPEIVQNCAKHFIPNSLEYTCTNNFNKLRVDKVIAKIKPCSFSINKNKTGQETDIYTDILTHSVHKLLIMKLLWPSVNVVTQTI